MWLVVLLAPLALAVSPYVPASNKTYTLSSVVSYTSPSPVKITPTKPQQPYINNNLSYSTKIPSLDTKKCFEERTTSVISPVAPSTGPSGKLTAVRRAPPQQELVAAPTRSSNKGDSAKITKAANCSNKAIGDKRAPLIQALIKPADSIFQNHRSDKKASLSKGSVAFNKDKDRPNKENNVNLESRRWFGGGGMPWGLQSLRRDPSLDVLLPNTLIDTTKKPATPIGVGSRPPVPQPPLPHPPAQRSTLAPLTSTSYQQLSLNRKEKKLNKIMKFVQKNKRLLKAFIEEKRDRARTRGQTGRGIRQEGVWGGRGVRGHAAREQGVWRQGSGQARGLGLALNMLRQRGGGGGGGGQRPVMRAELPSHVLDLVHARGAKISSLRAQSRLCQRHILNAEGPKYSHKGVSYKPIYEPKKGRDFADTRPPKILIPICCNCCAKSVFGCE